MSNKNCGPDIVKFFSVESAGNATGSTGDFNVCNGITFIKTLSGCTNNININGNTFYNSGNVLFNYPITACTGVYTSNLYGCSPIKVWDNLTLSGSVIDSQGGGYLDLRYGNSDGRFYLGNDNGGYSDTFIQGENGYLEISSYDTAARIAMFTDGGNAGFILTNDTSFFSTDISLYTDTTSIVSTPNNYIGLGSGNSLEITNDNVWVKGNETFNITTNPHSGVGLGTSSDLLIATVTGTSYTTNTLRETNPSILSSQYSTIQMGIKNSVILGGYNLNATQDNTAYVDNLNINTIGSGTSVVNLGLDSSGNVVVGFSDGIYVTGGTYTSSGNTITLTRNDGVEINITGVTGTYVTGGIITSGNTLVLNYNNGLGSASPIELPTLQFTGNTSGDCITDLYVTNLYGCSPLHIEPSGLNDVYIVENGGNVGIGTTSPTERLDVSGNTKISEDLFVGDTVYIGNVTGTPTTNASLYITQPSISSSTESPIIEVKVDDASSRFFISNNTGINGIFSPRISGSQKDNNGRPGLFVDGGVLDTLDTTTTPALIFRAIRSDALGSASEIVNRNLFQWRNFSSTKMTMDVDGNLGIGTTTPSEKLEVNGNTKISEDLFVGDTVYVGNVIGTPTTNASLYVRQPSITGSSESPIIDIQVDDANSYFRINNTSITDGFFTPTILTRQSDSPDRISFSLDSVVDPTYDTPGATDVVRFRARRDSDFIQNRDLFAWYNYTTRLMDMDKDGNLNILQGGLRINTLGTGTSVNNLGIDSSGNVVTGTTGGGTFTGNTSGDCISDIFVSNIHSCSPLNINPNDEGNVYFGSTSGVTIDVSSGNISANSFTVNGNLGIIGDTNQTGNLNLTGNTTQSGNNTLTGNLTVTGLTELNGLTTVYGNTPISAAIQPGVDNSYDLGNPSFRWREIWTTNIDVSNSASIDYLFVNVFSEFYNTSNFLSGGVNITGNTTQIGNTTTNGTVDIIGSGTGCTLSVTGKTCLDGDLIISGNTNISETPQIDTNPVLQLLTRDSSSGDVKIKPVPNTLNYGLFSQTGDSLTISATTTESSIVDGGSGTLSVPANGFSIGDSFRAVLGGIFSNNNGQTIRIRLKSGSVVLADSGVQTLTSHTNAVFKLSVDFTIRNIGAAGTASIVTLGSFQTIKKNSADLTGFGFDSTNNTTFNTTTPNTLDITVQWGSTSTSNQIKTKTFVLNKIY